MKTKPQPLYGLDLLHAGMEALADVEQAGIRIDVAHCEEQRRRMKKREEKLQQRIKDSEIGQQWVKRFGPQTTWGSGQQLAKILFEDFGYVPKVKTASGAASTSEAALEHIDDPVVKDWIQLKSTVKILSTYLGNFQREEVNGYIHPFFNLHTTRTFRSSSDRPNFQNIPVRDKRVRNIVRKSIIPRPGRRIVEIDYGGVEVRVAACYNKDPKLIEYINDPEKDMHRDMAAECLKLDLSEVTKEIRHVGKNGFVFAEFYGSYYKAVARGMWALIQGVKLPDGMEVLDYLCNVHGIGRLGLCESGHEPEPGTFEHHIMQVEEYFWKEMFHAYYKWRQDFYRAYVKRGYFDTLTGFRCQGHMKRNDVINYPVQGSAFHCLLWALIHLNWELKARKMSTVIIGQIHDSIIADVPDSEFDEYVEIAKQIMDEEIRKVWDWIIVPLEVEVERTPVDGDWTQKEVFE